MKKLEENPYKTSANLKKMRAQHTALFFANVFLTISMIFFLSTIAFYYCFDNSLVEGSSMQPTINAQWSEANPTYMDTALYSSFFGYHKGDIIIVKLPNDDKNAIKRLIATETDTVYILNHTIYLNSEALSEPYLSSQNVNAQTKTNFDTYCADHDAELDYIIYDNTLGTYVMTIPENYIFFLGDNRVVSNDCSIFGPQPESSYIGKVFAVIPYGQTMIGYFWNQIVR